MDLAALYKELVRDPKKMALIDLGDSREKDASLYYGILSLNAIIHISNKDIKRAEKIINVVEYDR